MKSLTDLLQAIAALSWPILTFVLFWHFRHEISDLLKRIKRGKFFGQELELVTSLDDLNRSALAAAVEVKAIAASAEETEPNRMLPGLHRSSDESHQIKDILLLAQTSPKLALISLATEIEKELREILFSQGQMGKPYKFNVPNAAQILQDRELLDTSWPWANYR
jgi:hypothetical protein